jgi:ABC-type transporter Mla MlaB component
MATQDNGSGLLSKVAKFVLNPTVDWVDLDKPAEARVADNSKLALKQMIERKQYNDAVRKREFDKLRRLRLNPMTPVTAASAPTSAFQDSWGYSVFEERANTLKKIDEIEAQMSKQWWKGRSVVGTSPVGRAASAARNLHGLDSAFATTMPSDLEDEEEGVPTQMGAGAELGESLQPLTDKDVASVAQTFASGYSKLTQDAAETVQSAADATLEEAAIRFANSDDGGAETVLLAALQAHELPTDLTRTWAFALLDIYRATGQQVNFERMAADYARRFNLPAPLWVPIIRQQSGASALPTASGAPLLLPLVTDGPLQWASPVLLDAAALQPLLAVGLATQLSCRIDWSSMQTMTPQAGQALAALLARWCALPMKLSMQGVDALDQWLRKCTPMGDSEVPQFWWQLRLDLLRILRLPDDFDLVALDFCVTYEMSPPSWQPARCQLVQGSSALPAAAHLPAAGMMVASAHTHPKVLTGEILGDATLVLESLRVAAPAGQALAISCVNLVRVDFSAAGSMLNWLANAQAGGMGIELREVPLLVAAFFQLIGINEHARIFQRNY